MHELAPSLSFLQLRSLDAVCDRFEKAWQGGQRPSLDSYLPQVEEAARSALLVELIRIELEWRCRQGEEPSVEEYARRYPACADTLAEWLRETRSALEATGQTPSNQETGSITPQRPVAAGGSPAGQKAGRRAACGHGWLGEYELLEPLGHGGMGEVWKARHRRLDKLVALKRMLARTRLDDTQARARFLRELQAVGRLEHPNLVEAHDAGEDAGVVYLVMKLLEGKDLARLLRERTTLPVHEACQLLRQAAQGLQYLHEQGLVHRDIKPSNLMRLPDGTLKILDFGLARFQTPTPTEEVTQDGATMGTPDYVAPEQIESAATVDIRADLYSLGATLFQLLTGKPPFAHHRETWPKLDAHRREMPPDVRTLCPDVPPELATLVGRLLAKKPADRPQTPAEVATALAPFCGGTPSAELGTTASYPLLSQPRKRRPWLPWAVGLAAAGCLVAVLAVVSFWRPSQVPSLKGNKEAETPKPPPALPLEIDRWEAEFIERIGAVGKPRGLLGVSAFQPREGDRLGWIEADLSEPAHAYLIAYRPDGKEELCWPEQEDQPPPSTRDPRYPQKGKDVDYDLSDGTGLQVFILAASRRPLPSYEEWKSVHGQAPWKAEKLPEELHEVVWRDRGLGLDGWTQRHPFHPGAMPINRGKDAEKLGIGPLVRLKRWWTDKEAIEKVAVLAVTVGPR